MSETDTVRAWKDRRYRRALTPAQRDRLPANPAGVVELSEERLAAAGGECTSVHCATVLFLCQTLHCLETMFFTKMCCCLDQID